MQCCGAARCSVVVQPDAVVRTDAVLLLGGSLFEGWSLILMHGSSACISVASTEVAA